MRAISVWPATKGAIATIVAGNPFSTQSWNFGAANFGAGNFEDRVRALMKDRVGRFPVSFHGANTTKPYRVVVVFNPRQNVDNRTIFLLEKQTPMTANSTGVGPIVFCDGNILKSSTGGRVGGVKDQGDPKLISLIRQVACSIITPSGLLRQRQRENGP